MQIRGGEDSHSDHARWETGIGRSQLAQPVKKEKATSIEGLRALTDYRKKEETRIYTLGISAVAAYLELEA